MFLKKSSSPLFSRIFSRVLILTCLTLSLSGCLQEGKGVVGQGTSKIESRVEYPSGPYGVEKGEVIENLSFTLPNEDPFELNDLYQVDHNRLLLISTSAEWCTACIKEQPKLKELYETYHPFGLNVMVSLFQTNDFFPASAELAQSWKERYELPFVVVADPQEPSTFSPYYDINLTPMTMLVDVQTMEIIYLTQGFDEDQVTDLIKSRLPSDPIRPLTYPDGPYGKATGEILDNLSFTQISDAPLSLNHFYQDHSKTLLLLTTSAEWCTACIKEQPKLEDLYLQYQDQGLEVVVSMFQDSQFSPANAEIARLWKEKYDLSFWVLADQESPSVLSAYYDVNLTPMIMLVNLQTMKIIYIGQGFDEETVLSLIEQNL